MPSARGSPHTGIKPMSLTSPALAIAFFITSATWESQLNFQAQPESLRGQRKIFASSINPNKVYGSWLGAADRGEGALKMVATKTEFSFSFSEDLLSYRYLGFSQHH